jgi:hypothetical protein
MKKWNSNVLRYDSGARQGFTPFKKPLFEWNVPFKNIAETKQNTLSSFADDVRGPTDPFLIKDAYDYIVNSVVVVAAGATNGQSFQTFDAKSFSIRIDTLSIATITSAVSGFVTLGTEFSYDQDLGIITADTIDGADVWSVRSAEYYRKVAFKNDYSDTSPIWNQFNVGLVIEEIV